MFVHRGYVVGVGEGGVKRLGGCNQVVCKGRDLWAKNPKTGLSLANKWQGGSVLHNGGPILAGKGGVEGLGGHY